MCLNLTQFGLALAVMLVLLRGYRVLLFIDGYRSDGSGVHQGSMLGPFFFFLTKNNKKMSVALNSALLKVTIIVLIYFCVSSGKTEYQTTKGNKARRSASFERRPSRRYSRRTMQNRGEDSTQTHSCKAVYITISKRKIYYMTSTC